MRNPLNVLACALLVSLVSFGVASADGFVENKAWAVRTPKGPIDKGLSSHTPANNAQAPSDGAASSSSTSNSSAPSASMAASVPPATPPVVEEATPTPPVKTQSLGGADQAAAAPKPEAKGPPFWSNRWFWALAALGLLGGAGLVEWQGRKRDEALAAEEPDDAPLKA